MSKKLSRNARCPCGSGKKYKHCCLNKGFDWEVDEQGNLGRSVPVPPNLMDEISNSLKERGNLDDPEAKVFQDMPPLEQVEHELSKTMREAGIDPALRYAFEKTGRIVSDANMHLIPQRDLDEWDAAIREYRDKHGDGEEDEDMYPWVDDDDDYYQGYTREEVEDMHSKYSKEDMDALHDRIPSELTPEELAVFLFDMDLFCENMTPEEWDEIERESDEVWKNMGLPSDAIEDGEPAGGKPEFPIGTVAFYGPNDRIVTKIAAGVIKGPNGEPIMERWAGKNIDRNPKTHEKIREFFREHDVKRVVCSDGIMGCPHEEVLDFPKGGDCPFCPWWKGKQ